MILFMLTNIMTESSDLIFFGDIASEVVANAFEGTPDGNSIMLEGVVSRKKQLIPAVMTALQQ